MTRLYLLAAYVLLISFTSAMAESKEAVERNSLGTKLLQEDKVDLAIQEFQKAVRLDPKNLAARLNLAYANERAERIEDAMGEYRGAIELEPESFFAHNNLGVLYDKKGLYDQAIAEFEAALKSEPGNPMALKNMETAKQNKATVQEREAQIQQAEKEAHAKPADPRALYNLARLYAFYGRKSQAQEWLMKALKQGYKDFDYLKVDPAFNDMREDRNFEGLFRHSNP